MPLGFERLNERSQRPNALINFIKPLTSASVEEQKIAKDFLERIAAQCYPVMKRDHISVMALEQYPANKEFLGRNFNAGEVIQLVLKDKAGRWLSFKFVQMVMMHELAHCKQMNHSRFFWQVRNQYAAHMKELWASKYQGEGVWGRGQHLTTGDFLHDRMADSADIPEHLCGGTYRRARGKKRKRGAEGEDGKPKLSYAERQQKRIARKFGKHGEGHDLGEDELVRGGLEKVHRPGKPRVANSKRGRELRANAALARFDAAKKEQLRSTTPESTPELMDDEDSETDSEDDEYADGLNILTTLGKIKDERGRELYKVCGDEDEQNDGGRKELEELEGLGMSKDRSNHADRFASSSKETGTLPDREVHEDSETDSEPDLNRFNQAGKDTSSPSKATLPKEAKGASNFVQGSSTNQAKPTQDDIQQSNSSTFPSSFTAAHIASCPICSLENDPNSATCIACSHVLKTSLVANHWRCASGECKGSRYINAGDAGRCGLCGAAKPAPAPIATSFGTVGSDILRWD